MFFVLNMNKTEQSILLVLHIHVFHSDVNIQYEISLCFFVLFKKAIVGCLITMKWMLLCVCEMQNTECGSIFSIHYMKRPPATILNDRQNEKKKNAKSKIKYNSQ